MLNWLSVAEEVAYEFSNQVPFPLKLGVCRGYKCVGRWWKGEQIDEDRWEPVHNCHTRLCDVLQCASASIRGPLLNCMADSSPLYGTQIHTRTLLDQLRDPFSKKPLPPSLGAVCMSSVLAAVWTPARLWCHLLEARSPGVATTPCHSAPGLTPAGVAVRL